jgi:hypothetical protein
MIDFVVRSFVGVVVVVVVVVVTAWSDTDWPLKQ